MIINPLVSCIVATHNRSHQVIEATKSILDEPYPNLEIIVVDDGSTDHTFEVLKGCYKHDLRVSVVRNDGPSGPSNARNMGIEQARGKYVTFLDDDDLNVPGRIDAQVKLAIKNNADFVTCTRYYYVTRSSLRIFGRMMDKVTLNQMWLRNVIVNVTPLVSTELMREVMFDPDLPAANDYDAWIRCLQKCRKTVNYSGLSIYQRRTDTITITANRKKKYIGRLGFYNKHKRMMPIYYRFLFATITLLKWLIPDPRFIFYSTIDLLRKWRLL